jgi:hypothetical protein
MLSLQAGCQEKAKKELLVVEFKPAAPLKYKLISQRDITLELESSDPRVKDKNKPQKMSEKLEMDVVYRPLEVDPFGVTTVKGECKSAKVTRQSFTGKDSSPDAAEKLAGQTFTIKLSPTGKILDYTSLTNLVQQTGDKAFAENTTARTRIKNPDMLYDFIAMQWYLWDSVSTIEKPLNGVAPGQSWIANQLIPLPVPVKVARQTTYTLGEVTQSDQGKKAIINSAYAFTDANLENWPSPYSGRYAMRGMFGFLKGYKYKSIEGTGTQQFNIDSGVVENDRQHYVLKMTAEFMLPLGDSVPVITIDQNLTAELVQN